MFWCAKNFPRTPWKSLTAGGCEPHLLRFGSGSGRVGRRNHLVRAGGAVAVNTAMGDGDWHGWCYYEEFSWNNQTTNKPHSRLDVLSGETRAGTQSPTNHFPGACSRALLAEFDPYGQEEGGEWWFNLARASRFVCVIHVKLTASNSHWRKRVGQKQKPSVSATNCFLSAVNESIPPVVVGTKSFSQLLYMEKLHCIHRQENSSLPGICKKCILQTGVLKGHGWELFQSIHRVRMGIIPVHPSSQICHANRADIDPSRRSRFLVALRVLCKHT